MSWEPQRNKLEAGFPPPPKVAPNFLNCNLFWYALIVHKSRAAPHQSLTLPIGSKPHGSFACNCHEPGPCILQGFSNVWYGVTLQPGTDAGPLLATTSQDLAKLTWGMSPSDLLHTATRNWPTMRTSRWDCNPNCSCFYHQHSGWRPNTTSVLLERRLNLPTGQPVYFIRTCSSKWKFTSSLLHSLNTFNYKLFSPHHCRNTFSIQCLLGWLLHLY